MAKINPTARLGRDRLLVRCILERPRFLFGENFEAICEMTTEERWNRFVWSLEDPDEGDSKQIFGKSAREVFTEILSDVEAWATVECARKSSRHQQRSRDAGAGDEQS